MTPSVLALDLSLTATGVAFPDGQSLTIRTGKRRGVDRLVMIRDAVADYIDGHRGNGFHVAIEGPAFSRSNGMHELGQLAGVIYVAVHEAGIDPVIVSPGTVKKYATGKGTANKAEVLVAAVRRLGYDGADDNQADALWLRAAVLDALAHPAVDVPAKHREALAVIRTDLALRDGLTPAA